jgi:hypothetical protein
MTKNTAFRLCKILALVLKFVITFAQLFHLVLNSYLLFNYLFQATLTEGEGSVQLTS